MLFTISTCELVVTRAHCAYLTTVLGFKSFAIYLVLKLHEVDRCTFEAKSRNVGLAMSFMLATLI